MSDTSPDKYRKSKVVGVRMCVALRDELSSLSEGSVSGTACLILEAVLQDRGDKPLRKILEDIRKAKRDGRENDGRAACERGENRPALTLILGAGERAAAAPDGPRRSG